MTEYKWCAIDAEGDNGNRGLLGVAFYSDRFNGYLTNHDDIRARLIEHAEAGYTFLAHNASYDIPVIFWQLHVPVKIVHYNGRFNRGEWRYASRRAYCYIWDTLGLSGGLSLADLGKAIGLKKYDTPQRLKGLDVNKYEWKCDAHNRWECEECYAVRDAEIVYKFMCDFTALLAGWGIEPQRRLAGISVATWKMLDRPSPIAIKDKRIIALARQSYAGGRVETFKIGHFGNMYTADVCSMYPSVMLSTDYPSPYDMLFISDRKPDSIPWDLEGVAEVDISIPQMYIPPLPYSWKGQRLYPTGRIIGQWTFSELRYAVTLGCRIHRVFRAAYSLTSCRPFDQFVGTLWALRQEYESQNDPRTLFAKLLMNNLYGRIGMRESLERQDVYRAPDGEGSDSWNGKRWRVINGEPWLQESKKQTFHNQFANVLWASYTTAAARIKLHRYLSLQGESVVYCDTDSVFSLRPIVGLGDGLGALREPESYEEAIISAPKLYALKSRIEDMHEFWEIEQCTRHHQEHCDDCRWKAKAKGIPRNLALHFLRTGEASFKSPVKPIAQHSRRTAAGQWIDCTRSNQLAPHRRPVLHPERLEAPWGWSDTIAASIGSAGV